jgi:phosphomethylpyrimidine synthase
METQIVKAKKGEITPEMRLVAEEEGVSLEVLIERVAKGEVVILANPYHRPLNPKGVGKGLRVKVNANIGTSPDHADLEEELQKLQMAISAGADTVMDLSTGGDLDEIRRAILKNCYLPVGTVPIYQAAVEASRKYGSIVFMSPEEMFEIIEKQAQDGVDFFTVHCGLTLRGLERLRKQGRVTGIVSRGGAFLAAWMIYNERENPLYEHFSRLLEIAKKYDVTLSLGDGLRPGSIADASDRVQLEELLTIGELVDQAREEGVQVMVEGPGHMPLDQIEANVKIQKRVCKGAPFYVLGPLVTDIAPGYDHIACAIGGALAAYHGADFLCYVTPSEHLRLPKPEDVREGVIAARIAAHAADLARGRLSSWQRDLEMSKARQALDWKKQMAFCIDPEKARKMRSERLPSEKDVCTMCGEFCAIKIVNEFLKK